MAAFAWFLKGFVLVACKKRMTVAAISFFSLCHFLFRMLIYFVFSLETNGAIYLTITPCQLNCKLHNILMPLHVRPGQPLAEMDCLHIQICCTILFSCTLCLRSAQAMGLVPATIPCNKSQGLVASCELAIFATKSGQFSPCD